MEEENTKLKNVDEGINKLIINTFDTLINEYSNQEYNKSYHLLKALFYLIAPYDFDRKQDLKDIIDVIEETKAQGNNKPLNKAQLIKKGEKQYEFYRLVDELYRSLPKSYAQLGKWMQIIKNWDDIDERISAETFNTDVGLLEQKKKDLIQLSSEKLLKLMNKDHIHNAHSRWLIENGV